MQTQERLTRKEKKDARKNRKGEQKSQQVNFYMKLIKPMTDNQRLSFDAFDEGKHLILHGLAGTGKTFISLYLALSEIMRIDTIYKRIYLIRSIVPTRDVGFLPGNQREKNKVYEQPYQQICSELFGRGDAYDILKNKNYVEFISTSFIRGSTLDDCIVICDEINNMTFHELDSVITRMGKNCRVIFCGDFRQSDLVKDQDRIGLLKFMKVCDMIKDFTHVDFHEEDIVRSDLVKKYIIAREKLRLT